MAEEEERTRKEKSRLSSGFQALTLGEPVRGL